MSLICNKPTLKVAVQSSQKYKMPSLALRAVVCSAQHKDNKPMVVLFSIHMNNNIKARHLIKNLSHCNLAHMVTLWICI